MRKNDFGRGGSLACHLNNGGGGGEIKLGGTCFP